MARYAADVTHTAVRPGGGGFDFATTVEAGNVLQAAREAAEIAARRLYGEKAIATQVVTTPVRLRYRAFIGVAKARRDKRVLQGLTIVIQLRGV